MTQPHSLLTDFDLFLFQSGTHCRLYEKMGAVPIIVDGVRGVQFSVYAPAARAVQVVGDFNHWDGTEHGLHVRWDSSGIWEGFIPGLGQHELYKFRIFSHHDNRRRDKADPFGRFNELPPNAASEIWTEHYDWSDGKWMSTRAKHNARNAPISIYEVHLGSWKKKDDGDSLGYAELAEDLVDYVQAMGFTHVEFLPVMEHPFYPSWGYLSTGYFSPTSRFGNPSELKYLIDRLHQAGIGVFLDWVPAHFPSDDYALADFDGSHVFEHPDRRKGYHPDWNSLIFNFERNEIRSFLLSSAHFWMDVFHADGLRVDAVSSMIYLDYSRNDGEWAPNEYGGRENLAAISFLQELNRSIYRDFPGSQMIAEESTAFDGVTKSVHEGGLGFGMKWMMGWMNDTLWYFSKDPIYRKYHQGDITFSLTYAFSENFVLPLSHDEVVHGKKSILGKMPGGEPQRFANLRLLYAYMFTHPGAKMLFMGNELGMYEEWNVNAGLPWHLEQYDLHKGVQTLVKELNHLLRTEKSLHQYQFSPDGFEWVDFADHSNSVISYIRKSEKERLLVICNFMQNPLRDYHIGLPSEKGWTLVLNTDDAIFGGNQLIPQKTPPVTIVPRKTPENKHPYSGVFTLPPLSVTIYKSPVREGTGGALSHKDKPCPDNGNDSPLS